MDKFPCKFCKKSLTTRYSLNRHLKTCSDKKVISNVKKEVDKIKKNLNVSEVENLKSLILEKDKEIEMKELEIELKEREIERREKTIEKILVKAINKPTIQYNNNCNNKYLFLSQFNLTPEKVSEIVERDFTREYFIEGQRGVAYFTNEKLLKNEQSPNYICGDLSRQIFIYKNQMGLIEKDVQCKQLTKMIHKDIINKSQKLYEIEIKNHDVSSKNYYFYSTTLFEIKNIKFDNSIFSKTLAGLICNFNTYMMNYQMQMMEQEKTPVKMLTEVIEGDEFVIED